MENNQKLIDVQQPTEKKDPEKSPDESRFETGHYFYFNESFYNKIGTCLVQIISNSLF